MDSTVEKLVKDILARRKRVVHDGQFKCEKFFHWLCPSPASGNFSPKTLLAGLLEKALPPAGGRTSSGPGCSRLNIAELNFPILMVLFPLCHRFPCSPDHPITIKFTGSACHVKLQSYCLHKFPTPTTKRPLGSRMASKRA